MSTYCRGIEALVGGDGNTGIPERGIPESPTPRIPVSIPATIVFTHLEQSSKPSVTAWLSFASLSLNLAIGLASAFMLFATIRERRLKS